MQGFQEWEYEGDYNDSKESIQNIPRPLSTLPFLLSLPIISFNFSLSRMKCKNRKECETHGTRTQGTGDARNGMVANAQDMQEMGWNAMRNAQELREIGWNAMHR